MQIDRVFGRQIKINLGGVLDCNVHDAYLYLFLRFFFNIFAECSLTFSCGSNCCTYRYLWLYITFLDLLQQNITMYIIRVSHYFVE